MAQDAQQSQGEAEAWTIESLRAIYNRAPKFFRALDLEDESEIYK